MKDFDFSQLVPLHFALYNYDATITMGIAACEAEGDLFKALDLYESILQTEFEGVTGNIRFDAQTGTRNIKGTRYEIQNILASRDDEGRAHFTTVVSAMVDFDAPQVVEILEPYVYSDNTTNAPPALPSLVQNPNLIATGARITGLAASGLILLMSMGWGVWTFKNRKHKKVRASQPFFLFMICMGTFIMASAIIPASFQEPMSSIALDAGCMSFVWLLCLGFMTTFSALFTKISRINTVSSFRCLLSCAWRGSFSYTSLSALRE